MSMPGGPQPPTPKVLKEALGACREAFFALSVFTVAINLLVLASSIYMMQVYDRVLNSRSSETLLFLTLMVLFSYFVMSALEYVRGRLMVRMSAWLDQRLASDILTGNIVGALRRGGDRTAQGLRDLTTVRTFLTGPGIFPFMDTPPALLFLGLNYLLHPYLGLLSTVGAIILIALGIANELLTREPLQEAGKASRVAQYQADMSMRNADVLEAMGMLPGLLERLRKVNAEAIRLQAIASERAGVISAISKFTRISLQSLSLGLGAYLVMNQEATGGVMIGASIIMGRALAPAEQAIAAWNGLRNALNAYRRVSALLAATPPRGVRTKLPAPLGAVTIDNVYFAPPGLKEAVIKGISLEIKAGETVALIGPSAAGKTTLARLMVGTWTPQRGNVRLDGADLSSWEPDEVGPYIGYLPQDVELFSGTIRDNIARLGGGNDEKVVAAAKRAHAHEMILSLPNGYDTEIGDGGAFLSGGQRQRIGLARALFGDPKLAVLDEPNASLDSAAENRLLQTLFDLKSNKTTVILITHRINLVSLADKVLVMKDGQVEMYGPRDEVIAKLTKTVPQPGKDQPVPSVGDTSAPPAISIQLGR